MNILEALEVVEGGSYIRYQDGSDIRFIFQSVLKPFDRRQIVIVDLDDFEAYKIKPADLTHIDHQELEQVCMIALKKTDYQEVTFDEMIAEGQKAWQDEND